MYDVIIVGAGPAGLNAALLLARCRRKVLICDSHKPRNHSSPLVHGFLSRDGVRLAHFNQIATAELLQYPSVQMHGGEVTDARRCPGGFEVELADGQRKKSRKLLLSTGVIDILPDLPGAAHYFGRGLYPCAYSDAWEHRDQGLAVYGGDARAQQLAMELVWWSPDVVLCPDGPGKIQPSDLARLMRNGVKVVEDRIEQLVGDGGMLRGIHFESALCLRRSALFFHPRHFQRSPLPARLGCSLREDGSVACEKNQAEGVPGLFVAGNVPDSPQMSLLAAAEGAQAAHRLVQEFHREDAIN